MKHGKLLRGRYLARVRQGLESPWARVPQDCLTCALRAFSVAFLGCNFDRKDRTKRPPVFYVHHRAGRLKKGIGVGAPGAAGSLSNQQGTANQAGLGSETLMQAELCDPGLQKKKIGGQE